MTALGWQLVKNTDAGNPVSGDIRIDARRFTRLSSSADSIAQACTVELRWWLAEWFADKSRGTPYLSLLGQHASELTVKVMLGRVLRRVAGVRRMASADISINRTTRFCSVTNVVVEIVGGGTVPVDGVFAAGSR